VRRGAGPAAAKHRCGWLARSFHRYPLRGPAGRMSHPGSARSCGHVRSSMVAIGLRGPYAIPVLSASAAAEAVPSRRAAAPIDVRHPTSSPRPLGRCAEQTLSDRKASIGTPDVLVDCAARFGSKPAASFLNGAGSNHPLGDWKPPFRFRPNPVIHALRTLRRKRTSSNGDSPSRSTANQLAPPFRPIRQRTIRLLGQLGRI
jgi:hypothetical protein